MDGHETVSHECPTVDATLADQILCHKTDRSDPHLFGRRHLNIGMQQQNNTTVIVPTSHGSPEQ